MAKQEKKPEVLTYFEVALSEARTWTWKEYVFFIIESLYTTVLPFFAGMRLVATWQIGYLIFLILPIILRLNVLKKFDERKKKQKIFIKGV